jgi:hypothetical protein
LQRMAKMWIPSLPPQNQRKSSGPGFCRQEGSISPNQKSSRPNGVRFD